MGNKIVERKAGLVIVLPKYESVGSVRRLGPFMVFINAAIDRFGLGIQILEAGFVIHIGPLYGGICHIQKQTDAFDAKDATPQQGDK
jgi:hypothetical protein